jgi:hypothetical protein
MLRGIGRQYRIDGHSEEETAFHMAKIAREDHIDDVKLQAAFDDLKSEGLFPTYAHI